MPSSARRTAARSQGSERVESLVSGGAHPYADQSYVDAFGQLDGGDHEAFLAALERVLGEPIPPEVRPRLLANDLRALTAAAAQPRPSLEDVLPIMVMPCLLLVGEADGRRAAVEADLSRDAGDDPGRESRQHASAQ
jgi:hypothetical protein